MLNARPEVAKYESQIIAQSGLPGMVTVATSMAGRGTDILLGGNAKGLVENALRLNILDPVQLDQPSESLVPIDFDLDPDETSKVPPSITALIVAARARSHVSEDGTLDDEETEKLLQHVMRKAENLRSDVILKLKSF